MTNPLCSRVILCDFAIAENRAHRQRVAFAASREGRANALRFGAAASEFLNNNCVKNA